MNWKLIFLLSLLAIPMAFGTVYYIPANLEPEFWMAIFIFCAFIIAKFCREKLFLNGFMVSIFNCVWITAIHFILFADYFRTHPQYARMSHATPQTMRLVGLIIGPVVGVFSGLILGSLSWLAAKIVKKG